MKLPTLYTERLMIRPLSVLDADDMYEYAKTPLVGPMAGWPPHTSLSDTINVIKIFANYGNPGSFERRIFNKHRSLIV